ncbi:nitrilase-related carbon-nitrogen hydrolase, partial [Streptomyces virginiae]
MVVRWKRCRAVCDRGQPGEREPLRVGLVQTRWYADAAEHDDRLREGVALAAAQGATIVCLPELTRSPYFCNTDDPMADGAARYLEDVETGPTVALAAELATILGIAVHASLYERAEDGGLGYNTAVCVDSDGKLIARTRKNRIPAFPGYREDRFRPGDSGFPVVAHEGARFGFPTCWDEWFPELARAYSLAGAEILVHPTAIGSEVDLPDFDTRPMWEHAITANRDPVMRFLGMGCPERRSNGSIHPSGMPRIHRLGGTGLSVACVHARPSLSDLAGPGPPGKAPHPPDSVRGDPQVVGAHEYVRYTSAPPPCE